MSDPMIERLVNNGFRHTDAPPPAVSPGAHREMYRRDTDYVIYAEQDGADHTWLFSIHDYETSDTYIIAYVRLSQTGALLAHRDITRTAAEKELRGVIAEDYCKACGGEGWLPSLPEGGSDCPYCKGTGVEGG